MSFRSMLKTNWKPFYCILYGKRKGTWRITRCSCSALVGSICAFLICKCVLQSLLISRNYEHSILLITIPIIAIGFILTDAVKCITFLIFLSCFGKSGRSYLRALIFAFVISGPIANLSANTGEIVRCFSCSKILTLNLTRTRFDLMISPFRNTLIHMEANMRDVQEIFNQFGNVTKDLHKEILTNDDDKNEKVSRPKNSFVDTNEINATYVKNRYQNKFKNRCFEQLNNGKIRCLKAFSSVHKKCYNKMPFILKTLICWPFKVNALCKINILGDPERICDPSDVVPENFGDSYVDLATLENKLSEENFKVKVDYAVLGATTVPGAKTVEETAKNIKTAFNTKQKAFNSISKILQQILGFVILQVLYVCITYHKKYKEDLEHDNIYATNYFKHVDQRRKSQNKQSLLPLKKYELKHILSGDNFWRRTHEESKALTFYVLQFSLEIVTCCFFIFLDYVLVSILLIIRHNSEMTVIQDGEHIIEFQVHGSGLIARLLKITMRNFNIHETVSTYLTNESCLPTPTALPQSFFLKLAALYFSALLLVCQSSSFLRLRRSVCGYFYQKQEKRRILYLYNRLLKDRRIIKETTMKNAKYNAANRQIRLKVNLFLTRILSSAETNFAKLPIALSALTTSKTAAGFVTIR